MTKPTAADILIAIGKAESGDWIDPTDVPFRWSCELYDPAGKRVGDGVGPVPFKVPDGWRFELTPPFAAAIDEIANVMADEVEALAHDRLADLRTRIKTGSEA